MAKPELGTKRICPETGRKFYDLGKTPVISPYTGEIVPIAAPPRSRAEAARPAAAPVAASESIVPETADAEFVSLEDVAAEEEGKKTAAGADDTADDEAAPAGDDTLDDAVFIEEAEEGNPDVTDIIGDGVEKEDES